MSQSALRVSLYGMSCKVMTQEESDRLGGN